MYMCTCVKVSDDLQHINYINCTVCLRKIKESAGLEMELNPRWLTRQRVKR